MLLAAFAAFAQDGRTTTILMPAVELSVERLSIRQSRMRLTRRASRGIARTYRRSGAGDGQMELGRTEITGNQELPKVLYIVPWQKSDPGDLMGKPVNTLLDEVLAPLDREEFIRQVEYYNDLYGEERRVGAAVASRQFFGAAGRENLF